MSHYIYWDVLSVADVEIRLNLVKNRLKKSLFHYVNVQIGVWNLQDSLSKPQTPMDLILPGPQRYGSKAQVPHGQLHTGNAKIPFYSVASIPCQYLYSILLMTSQLYLSSHSDQWTTTYIDWSYPRNPFPSRKPLRHQDETHQSSSSILVIFQQKRTTHNSTTKNPESSDRC